MKLTHQQIEAGRSDAGGFNLAQIKALGFPLPVRGWPEAGWPKRLMSMEVTAEQYAEFLSLRGSKKERARRATPELFESEKFANELFEQNGRDLS